MDLSQQNNSSLIIKDSCILFDLVDLNLLDEYFQLQYPTCTTSMVIDEIKNDTQLYEVSKHIFAGRLEVDAIGEYSAIFDIYSKSSGLSIVDCSVLELAIRRDGVILSCDKSLRTESTKRNIIAKGVLWVIDELVRKGVITNEHAVNKLVIYPVINVRAPKTEITMMLHKYKQLLDVEKL